MKSKILVLGLTLGLVMSLLATGCTSPAPPATAEPVVLKQSCFAPPGHIYTGWAEEFGSRVAEATGNRVTVEVYPGQALCPAKEELTACHTGTIDMTYVPVTYLVGMVPLLNYAALPWCSPPTPESAAKASLEMDPILRKALEEYNVHLVWMQFLPGNMGLSTKKEVRTPEDLKGMKMRTSGGLADKLAVSWGAAPVSVPSPEMYTALQKGTIDAAMVTLPSVKGYRMVEVAPYYTDIAMGLNGLLAVVGQNLYGRNTLSLALRQRR